jgi:hypothetical protein
MVNGKQRLGRYVDPFCAHAQMQLAKHRWVRYYRGFLIGAGAGALIGTVGFFFIFGVLPILGIWYLLVRNHYRRQYDQCYRVLEEIVRTGQPVWMPYDRELLKLLPTPGQSWTPPSQEQIEEDVWLEERSTQARGENRAFYRKIIGTPKKQPIDTSDLRKWTP